jgi:hypothetical protein
MRDGTIDQYDIAHGWSTVADPLGGYDDLRKALEEQGFEEFTGIGIPDDCGVSLYKHPDGAWYLTMNSPCYWHPVLATSFPAMLAVLEQMQSYLVPSLVSNIHAIFSDLQELLVQEPNGPLWLAQADRNLREERMERARVRRAEQKAAREGKEEPRPV